MTTLNNNENDGIASMEISNGGEDEEKQGEEDTEDSSTIMLVRLLDKLSTELKTLDVETNTQRTREKYSDVLEKHDAPIRMMTDFQEQDVQGVRKKLRHEKMKDQSLCSRNQSENQGDSEEEDEEDIICDTDILEEESIEYNGIQYSKNKCYSFRDDEDVVFGIKHLLKNNSACCIEVIKFEGTCLERIGLKNTLASFSERPNCVGTHVQRGDSLKIKCLSDLGELAEEIKDMPGWMYKEQGDKGSSKLHFALINVSTNPKKHGLRQTRPVGMDCFSGAGLFSVGLESADLNVKFAIEKVFDPVQSYANIHNAEVVSQLSLIDEEWSVKLKMNDGNLVFHCTMEDFLSKCEKVPTFKEALDRCDFVVLSPPCQGFSTMNRLKGGNALENNEESLRILKVAELLSPKILLFENVFGLWETGHINGYLRPIVYGLINMNYSVQVGKICGADYGDPQIRRRLYLIASRSCVGVPVIPKTTHSSPNKLDGFGETTPYNTVSDLLKGEEDNFPETESRVMDEELVTYANKPVPTVLASKSYLHYCKNRRYSLIENALLMGQERDFVSKLTGNDKSKQRQIGNGVPMGMAKAMGRAIHEVLKWEWEGEDD